MGFAQDGTRKSARLLLALPMLKISSRKTKIEDNIILLR